VEVDRLGDSVRTAEAPVSRPMRVIVVARRLLHRQALQHLLNDHGALDVVGSAGTARDALTLLRSQRPEFALVDLSDERDVKLAAELVDHAAGAGMNVIGIAMSDSEDSVIAAAEAGLSAFVAEDSGVHDVVAVMSAVRRGELPCSPRVAAILRRRLLALARDRAPIPTPARLTTRELDIMELVEEGRSNQEIAQRLSIEISTVKNHLHNIFDKLDVHNRADAVKCLRAGSEPWY
jgi:two-component system nitrate/nitrite response regulator NarL